jgi:hypothetical protein
LYHLDQIYTGDDEYDQDGTNETIVDDMDELDGFNDNNSTFSDDLDPMDGDENSQESTNEPKSTGTGADNDSDSNADSKADADADFRIVLLGDDYSSGNAASEDLSDDSWFGPQLCWRNKNSWGQQAVAQAFGSDAKVSFTNAACSMAKMEDLIQSQSLNNGEQVDPQINSVTSETDIVMLTTGANNANYEQLTKKCFIEGLTGGSEQSCTDTSNDSVKYIASGFANDYEKFLMNIAQKMKTDGMIVVVAYPFLALDEEDESRNYNIRKVNSVMITQQIQVIAKVNQQLNKEKVLFYTNTIQDFQGKEGVTGRQSNMIPTPTKPNPNGYFKEFTYSTNYDYDKPVGNKATFYRINKDGHSSLANRLSQYLKSTVIPAMSSNQN